ncbi:atherin-like [Panicum virgatum]|uniref:atherin-like n=1 Tax=Panicum virgatum TaxID=38727 RepID=UPI0019D68E8E|nr:atherin-like [Panicum virgatum]
MERKLQQEREEMERKLQQEREDMERKMQQKHAQMEQKLQQEREAWESEIQPEREYYKTAISKIGEKILKHVGKNMIPHLCISQASLTPGAPALGDSGGQPRPTPPPPPFPSPIPRRHRRQSRSPEACAAGEDGGGGAALPLPLRFAWRARPLQVSGEATAGRAVAVPAAPARLDPRLPQPDLMSVAPDSTRGWPSAVARPRWHWWEQGRGGGCAAGRMQTERPRADDEAAYWLGETLQREGLSA